MKALSCREGGRERGRDGGKRLKGGREGKEYWQGGGESGQMEIKREEEKEWREEGL